MSDRLQRSMALMDAKADVKMIKERTNECWYDTKILANAVYLILEELTATDTADTPQTEETCERCVYVRGSQWCQGCNGTPKRWDGEKIVDTPQTELTAKCLNCHNAKACKENHWDGCIYEPQTDCSWK